MATKIIRPESREEWLKYRESGIGSSEVATIVGLNPWESPYQLWRRKLGLDPAKQENFAMKAGHYLEDAVAQFWHDETGCEIIKRSAIDWLIVNTEKPYMRVSPDRTYWLTGLPHNAQNKGILECKTTQMDIDDTELPKYWFCQLMYQLGVMGYRQGSLAWLIRGRKFGYRDIDFDADFYAFLVERLEKFWRDCIVGDQEPPVTTIDDIQIKFPRSTTGKTVEVTEELMDDLNILKSIKPQLDELTRQKKEIEDRVKTFMADADTLCMAGTKEQNPIVIATWKTAKDSIKFNEKQFAAEHPELYADYQRTVAGSRRFLIK